MPRITTTKPDGTTVKDTRPGHTISGLLYTLDPFQRAELLSPTRVHREITAWCRDNRMTEVLP
jgi:hypothetical protein